MRKFEKKLNELEILSKGYWGTIYILSEDRILKTAPTSTDEMIKDEFTRARIVFEAGVPCAEPVELVETEEGLGEILERIQGGSLARRTKAGTDDLDTYLDAYARLAKKMASISIAPGVLPDVRDEFLKICDRLPEIMPEETVQAYRELVAELPAADRFLHLDFHWSNVMYNGGECKLIDMPYAAYGHPAFDMMSVAYVYHLLRGYTMKAPYEDILRVTRDQAKYIWDGLCARMFEALPAEVAADRKKMTEIFSRLIFAKDFMQD